MKSLLLLVALASAGYAGTRPTQGVTQHEVTLDVMRHGQKAGMLKLPVGRAVEILDASDTQYHIRANGLAEAWVDKTHVSVAAVAAAEDLPGQARETPVDDPSSAAGRPAPVDESSGPISPTGPEAADAAIDQANDQNREIIKPGELVFLQLPFTGQEKGGICAGSSLLNIADYVKKTFQLTQTQFFSLFDSGSSGANAADMEHGLRHINFTLWPLYSRGGGRLDQTEKEQLLDRLMAELDDRQPLSISRPGHAFVLVGYNKSNRVFYAWDQNKKSACEQTRKAVPHAPPGTFEIPMDSITTRLDRVDRLVVLLVGSLEDEGAVVQELASIQGWKDLRLHFIPKKGQDGRKHERAAGAKVPLLVGALLNNRREVAIPSVPLAPPLKEGGNSPGDPLVIITGVKDDNFVGLKHPEAVEVALSKKEVTDLVMGNGGRYWSYFDKDWTFQPRK